MKLCVRNALAPPLPKYGNLTQIVFPDSHLLIPHSMCCICIGTVVLFNYYCILYKICVTTTQRLLIFTKIAKFITCLIVLQTKRIPYKISSFFPGSFLRPHRFTLQQNLITIPRPLCSLPLVLSLKKL